MAKRSFPNILIKLTLLVASIVLALFTAEGFIRVFFPEGNTPGMPGGQLTKTFWKHDVLLGWRQLPNIKLGWKGVPVVTNSKGLRDKEYSYERNPEVFRILTLGDSFVWGWGVKREEMFTKLLEKQKNNLEVISMGAPGYSTDQAFLWLKDEGLKYKPDILLLLIEGGDFTTDTTYMIDGRYKPLFVLKDNTLELTHVPVPDIPVIRKIHVFLRTYSYLYMFLYKRELTSLGKIVYEKLSAKPLNISSSNDDKQKAEAKFSEADNIIDTSQTYLLTRKLLEEIKKTCTTNNIRLVFAAHKMSPEMIAVVESVATETNSNFINLEHTLVEFKNANPGKQIILGPDDNHWNPLGHKIVAAAILKYFNEHQLFPK